jgi:hypothetical protein
MLQQWILQRNCCGTFKMPASCTTTLLAFFCTSTTPGNQAEACMAVKHQPFFWAGGGIY